MVHLPAIVSEKFHTIEMYQWVVEILTDSIYFLIDLVVQTEIDGDFEENSGIK